jgi:hypothetical protein
MVLPSHLALPHQPGGEEHRQVLRDGRAGDGERRRQALHRLLPPVRLPEVVEQGPAHRMAEHGEEVSFPLDSLEHAC